VFGPLKKLLKQNTSWKLLPVGFANQKALRVTTFVVIQRASLIFFVNPPTPP
jgi:hypothetical protein